MNWAINIQIQLLLKLNSKSPLFLFTLTPIQIQLLLKLNSNKSPRPPMPSHIQIQLLLKLNIIEIPARPTFGPNSNTTLVKVKYSQH